MEQFVKYYIYLIDSLRLENLFNLFQEWVILRRCRLWVIRFKFRNLEHVGMDVRKVFFYCIDKPTDSLEACFAHRIMCVRYIFENIEYFHCSFSLYECMRQSYRKYERLVNLSSYGFPFTCIKCTRTFARNDDTQNIEWMMFFPKIFEKLCSFIDFS